MRAPCDLFWELVLRSLTRFSVVTCSSTAIAHSLPGVAVDVESRPNAIVSPRTNSVARARAKSVSAIPASVRHNTPVIRDSSARPSPLTPRDQSGRTLFTTSSTTSDTEPPTALGFDPSAGLFVIRWWAVDDVSARRQRSFGVDAQPQPRPSYLLRCAPYPCLYFLDTDPFPQPTIELYSLTKHPTPHELHVRDRSIVRH